VFAVAYSLRFIHDVFFNGDPVDLPRTPHEPPRWMKVPVEVLVVLCLVVGIFPAQTVEPLLAVASAGVLQERPPAHDLAIWHGFSPALGMSVIALMGGGLVYLGRKPVFAFYDRHAGRLEAKAIYNALLEGLFGMAGALTRRLDTGSLQRLLAVVMLSALVLGAAGFVGGSAPLTGSRPLLPVDGVSLLAALGLVAATAGAVIWHRQRLVALILVGSVGLLVALTFVKFSAPDLALTQLAVEMVTVVLLLLALYFLPQHSPPESTPPQRGAHLALAVAAGGGAATLTWAVLTRPYDSIAGYFLANSVPGGGGANVVNVILVDFRGYDTLGEISVLALAGLGIYALLERLRLDGPEHDAEGRPWDTDIHPVIVAALGRLVLPLALLVSAFMFLRGHNLPGGGFIAGLVTAAALVVQYLANGVAWSQERLPWEMPFFVGLGLLAAAVAGLGSLLFGYPFLTSTFGHFRWPLIGEFELASAMVFDLGVYLVVVGASLSILVRLGLLHRLERRAPRVRPETKTAGEGR
ncbi:MAG TPA: MnhB domain-containing protein, partial [Candidatus Competibacter sp.]|nr:MnhB domain-containing protein [Candidatus Competibacter sp.]